MSDVKINLEESEKVEFKKSLSEIGQILETVSAFANTNGGKIYIGVSDDGNISGIQLGKGTLESLANTIRQNTDPIVYPGIEIKEINSFRIIIVDIPEYPLKPVWIKEKVFIRVSKTNQRVSAEKIREMIKKSSPYHWDKELFSDITISELDKKLVFSFIATSNEERNSGIDRKTNISSFMNKIGLFHGDKLTHAAILLFGKNPQKYFPRTIIKCGKFLGAEAIDFEDIKEIDGTLINQVSETLKFLSRHINISVNITNKPEREEKWEIPREALREAVINAICHRNYEDTGNIQVRIFNDRLEIWNPGSLPSGLTLDSLKRDHRSLPHNELIAHCFYMIKYIEQWGTGTNRMIKACKMAGLKEPTFEILDNNFIVRFYFSGRVVSKEISLNQLNETQKKIIRFIIKRNEVKASEISEYLGFTVQVVRRNLRTLSSILEWSGKSKTDPKGKYSINKRINIKEILK